MPRRFEARNARVGEETERERKESPKMMMRRRRPLMRAAMVGGVAYHAGKKVQQGREEDAYRDQQISDFPLCNKSFNLSYCGHDL